MMPFFLTMPISRMMPMMPITDRSKPPELKRQQRADAGRWQRRENRQRMDEALVEHAEDDVDDDERGARSAAARSTASSGTPARCPGSVVMQRLRAADLARRPDRSRSTACPSATPGCRLNDSVTAGNCPWCATESGPGLAACRHPPAPRAAPAAAGERRLHVDLVERRRGPSAARAGSPARCNRY